ncbi:hypothetical protein GUJ93_ZPchr0002g24321 [Zizania palustris]|uniref:Uncharacterized protein n=1 Tax=Zizania palustris TaxID=103762 RepID=A0A8J5SFC6_ZIZPA|nr:hypothetical protein GUJ93_ZPchr0002g24321 [Zizania palustris]
MANFPTDPLPFLPHDGAITDGGGVLRKRRNFITLTGRSWTFPVYILTHDLADIFPVDEDDLPPNGGNPHPFNGHVFPGELEWVQNWVDEQLLNAPNLNGFGANGPAQDDA